jgi:predicted O-methyltransferase YrrM
MPDVTTSTEAINTRHGILSPLPEPFCSELLSMYADEPQIGSDGQMHTMHATTRISREQGMWIYNLCRAMKPKATLEIGLAYGFSTIYFLAAIRENGAGFHTAVDPFQDSDWHGVGSRKPERVGMSDHFRLIRELSVAALVHSADAGEIFDVIFVDGNHRFDDVLVDFTLSAELCPMGGYIILDDMWMSSIQRAAAFIRLNRADFAEIQTPVGNIAVFRRTSKDARLWNHFVEFSDTHSLQHKILRTVRGLTPGFIRHRLLRSR